MAGGNARRERFWKEVKSTGTAIAVPVPTVTLLPARFRAAAILEATAARRLWTRFVDREIAAAKRRFMQRIDGVLRRIVAGHLDKGEAAGSTGFTVAHDGYLSDVTGAGEKRLKVGFRGFIGQIAHVELAIHVN
jgi:hypothetical protein